MSPKLKGRGFFVAKKWAQRKRDKKITIQIMDHVSDLKYKLMHEEDYTLVVCLANWKWFKKDFQVSSATMSLWMAAAGPNFLKRKLARKNKKKERLVELVTQIFHILKHWSSVPIED